MPFSFIILFILFKKSILHSGRIIASPVSDGRAIIKKGIIMKETMENLSEAVTEAVSESISFDGYNMAAKAPNANVVFGIIGIVLLFAAIIAVIVVIKRKHFGSGFALFGGIATYLVFNYFTGSIIATLLFSGPLKGYVLKEGGNTTITSSGIFILVYTFIGSVIPILGRMLSNKSFAYRVKTFGQNFSFGQGIACTQAVFTMSTLFQMVASMVIINRSGLETLVSGAKTQADANMMLDSAMDLINYKTYALVVLIITALILIVYQLAITVPLFALSEHKIKGGWYGMVFGSYIAIEAFHYMCERKVINEIVQFLLTAVVVAVVSYFCYKIYVKFYKSEERDLDKEKEERDKKIAAAKKMPKFENLSNL